MTELPYTTDNVQIVQDFIQQTRTRMMNGLDITFTSKASQELKELAINHSITKTDIENTILNLTVNDYYRGIDPSNDADFNVCAFKASVGKDRIEVYLKYGLETNGLQILIFSNHEPNFIMSRPFNN